MLSESHHSFAGVSVLFRKALVTALVSMLFFPAFSQNRTVKGSFKNLPVSEFLKKLESQSGFSFAYKNSEIDLEKVIDLVAVDEDIVSLVDRALSSQRLKAVVEGGRIVISKSASSDESPKMSKITGIVKTDRGDPLAGTSVIVKGSSNRGVITDLDGKYSIMATKDEVLIFDFLGFYSQTIKVGNQSVINIVLKENLEQLSEVLVVGYSPMRKSDFTGSIASVKSSEITTTVPTAGQSLVGKVAGVEVKQTSGAPGDGVQIRVRGVNSLTANSDPLYVIDGFPASEDVYINPGDIESIDILKDASACAIYGSRGASGVVLITTKRGKEGEKAKVSYDFSYGIQQLDHKVDLLDAYEYRDLIIDARNNSYRLLATAAGVSWSPYDDNTIRTSKGFSLANVGIPDMFYDFTTRSAVEPKYNTDWQDALYSNAAIMRHNISVTGGTKTVKYMASVGLVDQDRKSVV